MSKENLGHQEHMKIADNLGIKQGVERPLKVVFMGAGSAFFTALLKDVLSIPGADKGEMALVDVDEKRLDLAHKVGLKVVEKMGKNWTLTPTTNRREVLEGADYVISCIEVSGTECVRFDNDIPKKYGVDQCIGDTIGPGGLFKALRTVPVWLEVLKDIEELCPDALVLNYTNPMSIMCLASAKVSSAKVVGLCHSVQGSSHDLAKYADIPYGDMKWKCAGINHLAWFTDVTYKGQDVYSIVLDNLKKDKTLLSKDPVRLQILKEFGFYVTESSGHFSEYVPYYRKRQDLIDKHCGEKYLGESGFYAESWPIWRKNQDKERIEMIAGKKEIPTERSWEYASYIIEAHETNKPFIAHLTVPNTGLIDNLSQHGVVEVGCIIDQNGITPTHFGKLPPQCAALSASHMGMYEMATIACIEKSKEAAVHALMLDPLTAAVCGLDEIRQMTEELFEAEKAFLPGF
ncbi:MAG: alpha-galactosidase [Verrucomicrobiota bacterium]|nr:alpha-galactosidase [Verrucomicrobiota bacterium]